jgi:hypothetical protein
MLGELFPVSILRSYDNFFDITVCGEEVIFMRVEKTRVSANEKK